MQILQFHVGETFSAVKTLAKMDILKHIRNILTLNSNFHNFPREGKPNHQNHQCNSIVLEGQCWGPVLAGQGCVQSQGRSSGYLYCN